jgi:hypothetical protein
VNQYRETEFFQYLVKIYFIIETLRDQGRSFEKNYTHVSPWYWVSDLEPNVECSELHTVFRHCIERQCKRYADEDILTKQYFSRAHRDQRKELETGLIAVGAKSSLVVRA